jgi:hypothetical protein
MALSVTITKKSVIRLQDKLYTITVRMILKNDGVEVLNHDFSIRYRTGDSIANKKAALQAEIQAVIDNYKAEQVLYNNAVFETMCTNIETGLVL